MNSKQHVLEHVRRANWAQLWVLIVVWPAFAACGAVSPVAPSVFDAAMPPLAPCGVLPNYAGAVNSPNQPGKLYRWERFPVTLSIDQQSLSMAGDKIDAYENGIREGAVVWFLATNGVIGAIEISYDLPDAQIIVSLSQDFDDEVKYEGEVKLNSSGRVLLPGSRILLYPDQILRWATKIQLTAPTQLQPFVAKIMAHEMGHALGVMVHSPDPRDLMFGGDWSQDAPPYPWVTERDRLKVAADENARDGLRPLEATARNATWRSSAVRHIARRNEAHRRWAGDPR